MSAKPPRDIESFHQRIRDLSDDLPRRMHDCARYLSGNADRIAVSTVAELAAGAGVPPSAMMRFCNVMGFSGFSDMQRLFRDAYNPQMPDYSDRLEHLRDRGANSPSALLAEFAEVGRQSLENLAHSVDPRALDAAVERLAEAKTIHIIGFRRAFSVATYLSYAFEKMDVAAVLHGGTGQLASPAALRPGDALIAISFTPYTKETVELSQIAANRGLPVIAITDSPLGPFDDSRNMMLCVSEVDFGAFRSLSATLSLAIALAVSVGSKR